MSQSVVIKDISAEEITVEDEDIVLSRFEEQLQREYQCQTPSERSLATVASIAYRHFIGIREQIINSEGKISSLYYAHMTCREDSFHPYNPNNACNIMQREIQRLSVLSKESDRAYRQYITSLHVLRMMKQAPLQITVKAQTAIIGQNQLIQANTHE
ncbi:MAG: hypothetical protein NT149_02460 [Candidatus Gottesmanbacteria bacterium]|nr:hypothetical protein [Candidatus Gottesmanbacteria bacterium]